MIGAILRIRYELVAQLQESAIFTLFQARDRISGRDVSIRVFKPPFDQERAFVEAVGNAASRVSAVNHPRLERLDNIDEDEGRPFLLGQYSPGVCLGDRIKKLAPFSVAVAVQTALSILEPLEALHQAGIAHGDLSGENIVISPDGSAKLQLAGIWQAYSRSSTAGAVVLPSMAPYLAPEVSSGGLPAPASDVYAVGILLFHLLTGKSPYSADTPVALAMKHATGVLPSVRVYAPSAPVVLEEIVNKALAKSPGDRYPNASAMLADLRILQDALRFGKTLTWPLRPTDPAKIAQVGSKVAKPGVVQPVAPKMGAIRDGSQVSKSSNRVSKKERDVPQYLMYMIFLAGGVVISLVLFWFFLNLRQPKMVVVPNIVGKDTGEAQSLLQSLKLNLRKTASSPSDQYPSNSIIAMDPVAGDKVREGSSVGVIVSSGGLQVSVPDIKGMSPDQAKTLLQDLGLQLATPYGSINTDSQPAGQIADQDPAPGSKIDRNAKINVKISTGRAPAPVPSPTTPATPGSQTGTTSGATTGSANPPTGTTDGSTTPDSTGKDSKNSRGTANVYHLAIHLDDTLVPVTLKVEMDDQKGTHVVHRSVEDPNATVNVDAKGLGDQVVFRIFYDGELKKTITETPQGTIEQ